MDTTTINTTTMSDSDSIFNSPTITNLPTTQLVGGYDPTNLFGITPQVTGGGEVNTSAVPALLNGMINTDSPNSFNVNVTELPIEPIGIPVYLSGIIQLLAIIILLSKNKTRQATILFGTIGIYMLTVHCTYAGKSDILNKGHFNGLCRNFSYMLVLLPLISVVFVMVDDFENAWKNIKYNSGKIQLQLPTFSINKNKKDDEEEVLS